MLCCTCSTAPPVPSQNPFPSPRATPPIPNKNSRRAVLLSGATLVSSTCLQAPHPALASPRSEVKGFSAPGLYSFSYPAKWVLAYDRTKRGAEGAQVLVGNLSTVDTFSVSKRTKDGDLRVDGIIDLLVEDVRSTPTSLRFEVISSGVVEGGKGESYAEMEYIVETCRGNAEEELGGQKVCRGPNDMVLQTVSRRQILGVVRKRGVVYVLNGGALESRWGEAGDDVRGVVDSFAFL